MKRILAPLVAPLLAFALCGLPAVWARDSAAPTVLELFTSEGCSSCPPADALLRELARRPDVVALAYHVTYWDRLGWPDVFATDWGTARQRGYAARLGQAYVYTPQLVIDGATHVVGSREDAVSRALADSRADATRRAAVEVRRNGRELTIALPAATGRTAGARVLLATYRPSGQSDVTRGENRGRLLVHSNIATGLRDLGPWDGPARTLVVRLTDGEAAGGQAILLQSAGTADAPGPGPILGAGIAR